MTNIPGLSEKNTFLDEDYYLEVVDVSDLTDSPAGSSKRLNYKHLYPKDVYTALDAAPTDFWGIPGQIARSYGSRSFATTNQASFVDLFFVDRPIRITDLYQLVTTTGTATGIRTGIYKPSSQVSPAFLGSTLVADFGIVSATSTGQKTISSLDVSLTPGVYYILSVSNGSATHNFVRTDFKEIPAIRDSLSTSTTSIVCYLSWSGLPSNAYAGLPSTITEDITAINKTAIGSFCCGCFFKWEYL